MRVALWSIEEDKPSRLEQRRDWVEAHLEQWVKADASLVAEGLTWVGQQVVLPDGSRLDLVGLTREGGLVVAELKRGAVGIYACPGLALRAVAGRAGARNADDQAQA